jgi:hypothetical protein
LSSDGLACLFGLSVGLAGVLGDLAESLIKRDFGRKDASGTVPGFGGFLDAVDVRVLFAAAPVAYWWLRWRPIDATATGSGVGNRSDGDKAVAVVLSVVRL